MEPRRKDFNTMSNRVMNGSDEAPAAVKSADRVLDLFELLARASGVPHADISDAVWIRRQLTDGDASPGGTQ